MKWMERLISYMYEIQVANQKTERDKQIEALQERIHQGDGIVEIDGETMRSLLRGAIPDLNAFMKHYRLDDKYWLPSREIFDEIIRLDWTDEKEYRSERFDCDDFSVQFKARVCDVYDLNNVGIVVDYNSSHSYNIVVLADQSVWAFEPQSDRYYTIGDVLYKMAWGVLLL